MNKKSIFMALIVTAIMATAAIAQANEKRTKWERLTGHKNQAIVTQSLEAAGATGQNSLSDDSQTRVAVDVEAPAAEGPKGKIEGSWRATPDVFGDIQSVYTFGAGSDANAGVVIHSSNVSFVPAPSCINGQGTWTRIGDRSFIGTDEAFCFDSNTLQPAGKVKFRYAITINDRGTEFNGRAFIEGLDPDGNVEFSAGGPVHGVRMQAEPPPHP